MITTILSDFSRVILNPKDKAYTGTINGLYKILVEKSAPFDFHDYFVFNDELLNYYRKLKSRYSVYILTSGSIQRDVPEIQQRINGIFHGILTTQDYPVDKSDPEIYGIIAKELDKKPEEMLLIDDKHKNIDTAKAAGLATIHYTGNRELFDQLSKLLGD